MQTRSIGAERTARRASFVAAVGFAGTVLAAAPVLGADATAGRRIFQQQCALCHSAQPNDNGGAQGPNLFRVFGRRAAADPAFSYTRALRAAHLTWDAATLDRFLSSPGALVPGTAMVISLPDDQQRQNVIAYFQAVAQGTFQAATPRAPRLPARSAGAAKPAGESADWKLDAPGRVHRIDLAKLPAPFATQSAANFPQLVPRPADARLAVPKGFRVAVFTRDVDAPRELRVAPNGDVFVTETQRGRVKVMRPSQDGTRAASVTVFAQGLDLPSGMAFYPAGARPRWLYVAENNRVVRYPYHVGDLTARGLPQIIVPQLSPTGGGGHFTRDVVFSADGRHMFVSVGSQSNVAEDMSRKTPEQARAWDTQHGLGSSWDTNTNRAAVLVFDLAADGTPLASSAALESGGREGFPGALSGAPARVFADGLRNCAGLTIQPQTGQLWCTVNERDLLGDNLVPDYSTRVQQGGFYGWPWYYMGDHQDPRHAGERPDLAGHVLVPDVPYQSHSAPLNLTFYTASKGRSAFPRDYVGDGFAVLHGSWNRAFRTGHKIVRVRMHDGTPTGEYDDFLVGFIVDDGNAWGRPVAVTEATDGSLLLTDDGANLVYRISYSR